VLEGDIKGADGAAALFIEAHARARQGVGATRGDLESAPLSRSRPGTQTLPSASSYGDVGTDVGDYRCGRRGQHFVPSYCVVLP
jgi:hypothetical protein